MTTNEEFRAYIIEASFYEKSFVFFVNQRPMTDIRIPNMVLT